MLLGIFEIELAPLFVSGGVKAPILGRWVFENVDRIAYPLPAENVDRIAYPHPLSANQVLRRSMQPIPAIREQLHPMKRSGGVYHRGGRTHSVHGGDDELDGDSGGREVVSFDGRARRSWFSAKYAARVTIRGPN